MLKINAGAFVFEAANVRHEHEWTVWQDVKPPEGRYLFRAWLPTRPTIEHPDLVAQRIVRLAKLVGRENVLARHRLWLFPKRRFTAKVHSSIQWAKLRGIVQGAELASKALWRP